MRNLRLTPAIVGGIGAFVCVLVAVLIYILIIKPAQANLATQQARYDQVKQYTQASVTTSKKKYDSEVIELADVESKWTYYQNNKNPHIDLADRFTAWKEYYHELEFTLGPLVDNFLTKNKSGAIRLGTIALPAPPSDPNMVKDAVFKIPLVLDPFPEPETQGSSGGMGAPGGGAPRGGGGSGFGKQGGGLGGSKSVSAGSGGIQVIGTFDQVLNQVGTWNNFNRIVLVDNVSISGYSPFIVCAYDATVYEYTINSDNIGVPLPTGSASGGTTGGAGGGPGMPASSQHLPPSGMPK